MAIRKLLCLLLTLALLSGFAGALAEQDAEAQLAVANARIAELEAEVDLYYPYYQAQIVATYGEDGIVWLEDVQAEYDNVNYQYQSYGFSLEAYGMVDLVKRDIVDTAVKNGVLLDKAAELGLDQFDEETLAGFEAQAESEMEQYVQYYIGYFYPDAEEVTDEMRAEAMDYWTENGFTKEAIVASLKESATLDAVYEYAVQNVTVTEDDVQAAYESMVAANQESYADDQTYNSDRCAGVTIAWNPEGYRAVKQVLILFNDDQAQRYSDLQSQLSSLYAERDAILNPPEDAAEGSAPTRTVEEVDTDIDACVSEIDALYDELMPTAQEVVDAFNSGTSFDDLIAQYNQDPGMQNEPTASLGYAVSANSTYWDPAFTEGAMSIENVGEISGPVCGSNGIYIIYYMDDIAPGEVGLENIRESVEAEAEEQKYASVYDEQVAIWLDEANVEYFYENFGIAPDAADEEETPAEEAPAEETSAEEEGADSNELAAEPSDEESPEAVDKSAGFDITDNFTARADEAQVSKLFQ